MITGSEGQVEDAVTRPVGDDVGLGSHFVVGNLNGFSTLFFCFVSALRTIHYRVPKKAFGHYF